MKTKYWQPTPHETDEAAPRRRPDLKP